jgi:hypothetical protein
MTLIVIACPERTRPTNALFINGLPPEPMSESISTSSLAIDFSPLPSPDLFVEAPKLDGPKGKPR